MSVGNNSDLKIQLLSNTSSFGIIYYNCLKHYPDINSGYLVDLFDSTLTYYELENAGFKILKSEPSAWWIVYCKDIDQLNLFILWFGADDIDFIYEI